MKSKYALLEDVACDDEETTFPSQNLDSPGWSNCWRHFKSPPSVKWDHRYLNILRTVVLYSLALWGFLSIIGFLPGSPEGRFNVSPEHSHKADGCDCGSSVMEAISLGCKFDALSMAWLPKHCRDDELTAEFETTGKGPNGTWIYYSNTERTVEIDVSEVAAMGDDPSKRAHMDKDWHQTHCLYYWLKLHRTRSTGKIIEPRSDTEAHIRHCGMVFRKPGYGTISGVALNTNEVVEE